MAFGILIVLLGCKLGRWFSGMVGFVRGAGVGSTDTQIIQSHATGFPGAIAWFLRCRP